MNERREGAGLQLLNIYTLYSISTSGLQGWETASLVCITGCVCVWESHCSLWQQVTSFHCQSSIPSVPVIPCVRFGGNISFYAFQPKWNAPVILRSSFQDFQSWFGSGSGSFALKQALCARVGVCVHLVRMRAPSWGSAWVSVELRALAWIWGTETGRSSPTARPHWGRWSPPERSPANINHIRPCFKRRTSTQDAQTCRNLLQIEYKEK